MQPNLNVNSLRIQVDDAMDVPTNYETFNDEIQQPHNRIHNELDCFMGPPVTAAYDPVFWMHHGFVDKLFAQWQVGDTPGREKRKSFIESTRGRVMEPFNNRSFNDFYEVTNIPNPEVWDYQKNLDFEYDNLEWSVTKHQKCRQVILEEEGNQDFNWNVECRNNSVLRDRNTKRHLSHTRKGEVIVPVLEVRTYAAFVIPRAFGSSIPYKFCEGTDRCKDGTLNVFGGRGVIPKGAKVTSEDFLIKSDLQHNRLYSNSKIPSKIPTEMKWSKIVLGEKARKVVPLPAFVIYIIEQRGKDDLKIAHLPKGAKKSDYGDLLKGYKVKKNCDRIRVGRRSRKRAWKLGRNCK